MSTEKSQELDLQDLSSILKKSFDLLVRLLLRIVEFFFKTWWIILILGVIGFTLGSYLTKWDNYSATLIIKTNFNSQAFVYNAVEQFDTHLSERDNDFFLKNVGLNPNDKIILSIDIFPIIDVAALVDKVPNERAMSVVIDGIVIDNKGSIFQSEEFYSNYLYHKLVITTTSRDAQTEIKAIIDHINSGTQIKNISDAGIDNINERIKLNDNSLKQIDNIVEVFTEKVALENKMSQSAGYYNNDNALNIENLFTAKKEILEENEELKNNRITMDGSVYIVSDIKPVKVTDVTENKAYKTSFIFISIFILLAIIRFCYRYLNARYR